MLLGDADGFQAGEREAAHEAISLSRLTLPHQLCFVIVAEQLYRSTSIIRGEKYHRQ
ncbi:MAG: 23S rRNA (pseudouridine1915-N3)-methyltransferase [Myxococcota bacterium]|jgi:23S rRNA (pseudouridine1915-N3)-methyltransferase